MGAGGQIADLESEIRESVMKRRSVMKLQRTFSCITGVLLAAGLAASQASAGVKPPICDFEIEINALRGGSPTVSPGGTKDITAKARIAKGTALDGTTIDVQLRVETIYNGSVFDSQTAGRTIRLGIGKGGQGDKLTMNVPQCSAGSFVAFEATFFGVDGDGDECKATSRITKSCN
jgi:hypothetical protein